MATRIPYVMRAQLEARVSARTLKQLSDDNRDGTSDFNVVAAVLRDASSKVDSYLALAPNVILPIDPSNIPDEVVRLTLDVAVAMLAQRHPEVMRLDWQKLMDAVETELERVRNGKTTIGPALCDGPVVMSDEPRYMPGRVWPEDDWTRNND